MAYRRDNSNTWAIELSRTTVATAAAFEAIDPFVVGWALTRAQRDLQLALDAELAALGTNISQICVLNEIKANPAASNAQLAALTFQTPQSLGQQLFKMQERGLLERHPGDGRKLRNYITKAGDQLHRQGMRKARAIHTKILEDLDDQALASLAANLSTIATRAAEVRATNHQTKNKRPP
jgi:DNA-binding MarR family transcriptional regulator